MEGWKGELRKLTRQKTSFVDPLVLPSLDFVVGLGRVELPTSPLSGVRSNQLSYRPVPFAFDKLSLLRVVFKRAGLFTSALQLMLVSQN